MSRRRSRAAPRLRLASLDVLLSAGIVCLAVTLCLQDVAALADKARLAAVFIAFGVERRDSQELMAITGCFAPPGAPESLYSQSEPTSFEIVSTGPGLLAKGSVGHDAQPFAISFTPALSDDGEASVRWLCGVRRAPAGWRAASAPSRLMLPHGASFSICRDDGGKDA